MNDKVTDTPDKVHLLPAFLCLHALPDGWMSRELTLIWSSRNLVAF